MYDILGQKIYRGKGAKQIAAELEAGELARNNTLLGKNSDATSATSTSTSIGGASETMSGGLSDAPYSQDRGFYPHAKIALGEIMGPVPLRSINEGDRYGSERSGENESDFPTSDSEIHEGSGGSISHENGNHNGNEDHNGNENINENENENNTLRTAGEKEERPLNASTSSSSSSMHTSQQYANHSSVNIRTGMKENNESDGMHQNDLSNQDDENENKNDNDNENPNKEDINQLNDTGTTEINVVDGTNVVQTRVFDGTGSGSPTQHHEQEQQLQLQQQQSDSHDNDDNIVTSERAKRKLGDTDFVNSSNNNNNNDNSMRSSSSSSSNPLINREAKMDAKSLCAIRLNGPLIDTDFTKINNIVPSTSTYQ